MDIKTVSITIGLVLTIVSTTVGVVNYVPSHDDLDLLASNSIQMTLDVRIELLEHEYAELLAKENKTDTDTARMERIRRELDKLYDMKERI